MSNIDIDLKDYIRAGAKLRFDIAYGEKETTEGGYFKKSQVPMLGSQPLAKELNMTTTSPTTTCPPAEPELKTPEEIEAIKKERVFFFVHGGVMLPSLDNDTLPPMVMRPVTPYHLELRQGLLQEDYVPRPSMVRMDQEYVIGTRDQIVAKFADQLDTCIELLHSPKQTPLPMDDNAKTVELAKQLQYDGTRAVTHKLLDQFDTPVVKWLLHLARSLQGLLKSMPTPCEVNEQIKAMEENQQKKE